MSNMANISNKSIDFEEILKEKRQIVWKEIQKYLTPPSFAGNLAVSENYFDLLNFHWQMIKDYPERLGKYLRPALVLLTAQALDFPEKKALKTAAAMQISEDWILIHDDFEDNSLERRGKPALHQLYGNELSVNAGDALHVIMWKLLWDNRKIIGEEKAALIAEEFYQMLARTIFGQSVEIKWTKEGREDLSDEDIFFIFDGKTSYYTIAGPMRLGAILGEADKDFLEDIYEFGQNLGRCFQIIDDLLDLTSDFKGLKKQKGNDIYEGKRTLMLMHLLKVLDQNSAKNKLKKILKKPREKKTEKEVEWVIDKMKNCGSLDYSRKIAENFAIKSLEIFEKKLSPFLKEPARSQLKAGINFILKREY